MPILEGNNIWIKRGRLSFPALVKPKASTPGAEPKYSADIILEPDAPEWPELMQLIQTLAAEKWKDGAASVLNMINGDKRLRCYGEGNTKTKQSDGTIYAGYEGKLYVGGNNASQPQLIGVDGQPLPPTANLNELFNGGNYVSAIFNIWLQDNQYGKGVRANLVAVQYLDKGESFGATPIDATSVFQAVPGAPAAAAGAMPGMPGVDPLS